MIETFLYGKRGMRVSVASIRPSYMLCIRAKAGASFMKEKHFAACAFSLFPFLKNKR